MLSHLLWLLIENLQSNMEFIFVFASIEGVGLGSPALPLKNKNNKY
jgi:hypothetical protein